MLCFLLLQLTASFVYLHPDVSNQLEIENHLTPNLLYLECCLFISLLPHPIPSHPIL